MRRWLGRIVVALVLALIPGALGTLVAVLYTDSGTLLLARLVSAQLNEAFRGHFALARVDGSFLGGVELHDLVIDDSTGAPFARVRRLGVRYTLGNLLAGRIVLNGAELDTVELHVIKRANGRLNFHEIFRLGEGPPGTTAPPLIEVRNLRIRGGTLELQLPWSPPDPGVTPADRAAALAADRARPGRVVLETPDGLRRVLMLNGLEARLSLLRISDPTNQPLTLEVDSLRTRLSDPAIDLRQLSAHAWTRGDTLAFTLHQAELPHTHVSGGGVVTWPEGPLLWDFVLDAPALDLNDLHWISPAFPPMAGHTFVTAHSRSRRLNAYTLDDLSLSGPEGKIRGRVTALTDTHRGIGVEEMDVELADLDLDVPRRFLDTIPLRGTLTGTVRGAGFLDGLDVATDLLFRDADVPGAENQMVAEGHLVFGGAEGTVFDSLVLNRGDFDMRTVTRLAPSVTLQGRARLEGTLRGPWKNVTFTGTTTLADGTLPVSVAEGESRLDTRSDTVRFESRVNLAPLALDGIRPGYPGIPVRGSVRGPLAIRGTADHFDLATTLQGELGQLGLTGTISRGEGWLAADTLTARFTALDLSALRGTGPATQLTGQLHADGRYDSLAGPAGTLALDLGRGRVGEWPLDSLHLVAHGTGQAVAVDTVEAAWDGGWMRAGGSLAWDLPADARIAGRFQFDSLGILRPTLVKLMGPPRDTLVNDTLAGRVDGEVELSGSLRAPRLQLRARSEGLVWRSIRSPELFSNFGWHGAARPEVGLALYADTLQLGAVALREVAALAGGYQDSLRWNGGARLNPTTRVAAGGAWWTAADSTILTIDSLLATLPRHQWQLAAPVTVALHQGAVDLSPVALEAGDGSGIIRISGRYPREQPGALSVSALGLELQDVYALLERDTTGVGGTIQLDLDIGGTAKQPTFRGTGSLADLTMGDFGSPFVQGIVDYHDRRLDANLLLWKTGEPVLRLEAGLPLDLALQSVPHRQVDGPLSVRAIADSTDLGVVEAFTRNLRRVRGSLRADLEVAGTWEHPRLGGALEVRNASATVPGLGVKYEDLNFQALLSGDSVRIDSLVVRSGEGTLRATGGLRLDRLTQPIFDLTFRARRFRAIDVKRFLTLDASGTVRLTGPVLQPRLTGRVTADEGNLHFADLLTKRIVDLENPGDSGLIDLDLVRTERLGANFQSRFLDSLAIDTLQIQMGESFWLRSSEANIQLDGQLTVDKLRSRYRYDGTLNAVRGNYTLRIGGIVTRDFTVDRGTVRYFGTPDLNADLDIEASHTVIAAETSEEIPVVARITGTLLQPRLELSSPPSTTRPALSQTELVSYLMFGRPTFSLQGQNGTGSQFAAVQAGLSYLSSALSSEIQRSLISDLGVPIDYLDIRTGGAGAASLTGQGGSAQVAQVAAGWQIGRRWFVSVVADLCTNTQRFYPNAEFRISRALRIKSSVEPAYSCQVALNQPTLSVNKYQVGLDLLWEQDY